MRSTFLFLLSLVSAVAFAASNSMQTQGVGHGDYHFGYVSLAGGYTSLSHNISDVTTRGSWGALAGLGYEFRMRKAWVNIGCQLMQEQANATPAEYIYDTPYGGSDNQVPPQVIEYFRYTVRQTDRAVWRTVDIPLMAGYYNSGFYVGAGVKAGFSLGSYIATSGEYDLGAKYENFIGIIQSVPGFTHPFYKTYTAESKKYSFSLRPQFAVIGEIGYDALSSMGTNSTICHMLKIGVYIEYGVTNIRPNDMLDPIQIQDLSMTEAAKQRADVTDAHMTPYYLSIKSEGKRIAPFFLGVKLTYLIGGSWSTTKTWHKGCQCYGD